MPSEYDPTMIKHLVNKLARLGYGEDGATEAVLSILSQLNASERIVYQGVFALIKRRHQDVTGSAALAARLLSRA